jgi:tRNA A37 threonylcarbamoyladenosine synthetase subunit TsaC/SUA5/YrdC
MATISVPHTITLVADLDDTNPSVQQLLSMPEDNMKSFLARVFTDILREKEWLDTMNENGKWAIVRLPKHGELNG